MDLLKLADELESGNGLSSLSGMTLPKDSFVELCQFLFQRASLTDPRMFQQPGVVDYYGILFALNQRAGQSFSAAEVMYRKAARYDEVTEGLSEEQLKGKRMALCMCLSAVANDRKIAKEEERKVRVGGGSNGVPVVTVGEVQDKLLEVTREIREKGEEAAAMLLG